MTTQELFETTESELKEFRQMLAEKLGDRDSKTADAIDRNDAWGEIASSARSDIKDSALSDLHEALSDFADSMQASQDASEED